MTVIIRPGMTTCIFIGSPVNAEISMLNQELLEKKKNFSLEAKDKEIREMKKKRNILLDREARKEILDPSTAAVIDNRAPATNRDLLPSFEDSTFTGTGYGLKTMSVTVTVSRQMFETHINLYNEANIGEQLTVPHLEPTYLQLPKPFKITAPGSIGKKVAILEGQMSILSSKIKQSNNTSVTNYFLVGC
ncbi:hypothetical protein MFLAVUS_000524 [Mucor flavus]|uniref:Uncharacterized protein n=1 Tax=Mucor flavus TaxID=439312 RepID=A0ABP9YJY3_9FUNG